MTIPELLAEKDLERSLLIGFYGGGNYGDELLLEVLANLLKQQGTKQVTITHQKPAEYATFHHEFGYPRISMNSKTSLLRAIFTHKNIIVGGGGLWGLDMNFNVFVLSVLLFFSRFGLRKKVYLLGVGYYNSTSRLGRLGAWFAGKGASWIVARDGETFKNFQAITKRVSLDNDIAWQLPKLDQGASYASDLKKLEHQLKITKKTLFITLRRFRPHQKNAWTEQIETLLGQNQHRPAVVALLEPKTVDSAGYKLLKKWAKQFPNLQIIDFSFNPFALFLFFQKYHRQLVLVGPQFHIIMTAALCDTVFLPVAYDNKVSELLAQLGRHAIPIQKLTQANLQQFVETQFEGTA